MNTISYDSPPTDALETEVVIIGAGACGLTAALRANLAGREVLLLEQDSSPSGSTAMSSGFVPAPATRFQHSIGVSDDTPERFYQDLMAKTHGDANPKLTRLASEQIGPALEWLADHAGIEWQVLDDFLYPGHSRHRMHAVPEKTGEALENRLVAALAKAEIPLLTDAHATQLYLDADRRITAVGVTRPGGELEVIKCQSLVLACNGYGANPDLLQTHIPEIATGLYYGHSGNTGDAVLWGQAIGAELQHLSAYQGHGSLAYPHQILISWALMMEGGIQVNIQGERFSNEHGGYSEQATHVLAQPEGIAWNIYDQRIHEFAQSFPDYQQAIATGAIHKAKDIPMLAEITKTPLQTLNATISNTESYQHGEMIDTFGRDFSDKPALAAPYFSVKVTGALFHTQGGLLIDAQTRVLNKQGQVFPSLFAGGGAACGVSGPRVDGYLSGNGLLTAIAFGYVAGGHC